MMSCTHKHTYLTLIIDKSCKLTELKFRLILSFELCAKIVRMVNKWSYGPLTCMVSLKQQRNMVQKFKA